MTRTDGDCAPHSALHSPQDDVPDPNASVRAPAREDSPPIAQSEPKSAVTWSDQIGPMWSRIVADVTPPDIVTEDRPSLRKAWAYAAAGEWTTKTGTLRTCGMAYACLAISAKTVLYYLDWIIERPTRLGTALVLFLLFAQFPPLSWLV